MNISRVISDAMRGTPPRMRDRQRGGIDAAPPDEFLEREVWPLLKEARQALESRGFTAVVVPPCPEDPTYSYALLVMDSHRNPFEACYVRFLVQDRRLFAKVKHPKRSDDDPVLLDPPGSVILVQNILEDFVYHCVAPTGTQRCASREPVKTDPYEPTCSGTRRLSTV